MGLGLYNSQLSSTVNKTVLTWEVCLEGFGSKLGCGDGAQHSPCLLIVEGERDEAGGWQIPGELEHHCFLPLHRTQEIESRS